MGKQRELKTESPVPVIQQEFRVNLIISKHRFSLYSETSRGIHSIMQLCQTIRYSLECQGRKFTLMVQRGGYLGLVRAQYMLVPYILHLMMEIMAPYILVRRKHVII